MDRDRAASAGIQHVALEIEAGEFERARRFWLLVGFEQVEVPHSLHGRAVWMEAGPPAARAQIHLLLTEAEGADTKEGFGPSSHVAVVAPDFEATAEALRGAGFTVEERRAHWGAARAFVGHPGGHRVELMAAPPLQVPPAPTAMGKA